MDRKPALADSTNLKGLIIKHFYFYKIASATIEFEFLFKICFLVTSCLTSRDSHLYLWYSFVFSGCTNRSIWKSPFVLFFRLPRHYNVKCTILRKINTVGTKFSLSFLSLSTSLWLDPFLQMGVAFLPSQSRVGTGSISCLRPERLRRKLLPGRFSYFNKPQISLTYFKS